MNNIDKIPINIIETDMPVKYSHKVPNSLSEAQPQQTTLFATNRRRYKAWLVIKAPMRTTILRYLKFGKSSLFWDIKTYQPRTIYRLPAEASDPSPARLLAILTGFVSFYLQS